MKSIPLTKGHHCLVDDDNYEYLNQWKWFYSNGYAVRREYPKGAKGASRMIRMHRLVNGTPPNLFTDHINKNKLDNRKSNLRSCSRGQNTTNSKMRKDNKTGYRGVMKRRVGNCDYFVAQINNKYIGNFKTPQEASLAYQKEAERLHGEFKFLA